LGYGLASLIIFSSSYFTLAFQKMPVKYLLVSIVDCVAHATDLAKGNRTLGKFVGFSE